MPDWMIGIGRILVVNQEEAKVLVKILQQAGASGFSFGEFDTVDDTTGEESKTEEWTFEEVISNSWRIAPII